jgi:hypothetical protein
MDNAWGGIAEIGGIRRILLSLQRFYRKRKRDTWP